MGKDLVGPISGWRMVMISAGLFVGPVVLATIGSVWAGESHIGQFLGGLLGLGLGLIISVLLGRHMK